MSKIDRHTISSPLTGKPLVVIYAADLARDLGCAVTDVVDVVRALGCNVYVGGGGAQVLACLEGEIRDRMDAHLKRHDFHADHYPGGQENPEKVIARARREMEGKG